MDLLKLFNDKKLVILFLLIVLIAFFTRFYMLDYRPLHHDEGVIWYYFEQKILQGEPLLYAPSAHGFTPFYLTSIPLFFEDNIFNFRFATALFGSLVVVVFWFFRKILGDRVMLIASFLVAVSPSLIYYSKFGGFAFMLVNFITLLILYCGIKYYTTRQSKWVYFIFILFAFGITSHEIILIPFLIFGMFFVAFNIVKGDLFLFKKNNLIHLVLAFCLGVLIIIFIMTNAFSDFGNLSNITFDAFFSRTLEGHDGDLWEYLLIFIPVEFAGFIGILLYLIFFKKSNLNLFFLVWCFGSILVLSIFPYKTPWMFTTALLPILISAGIGFNSFIEWCENEKYKQIFCFFILIILVISILFSNFTINYAYVNGKMEINPLNYAGPLDDFYRLLDDINKLHLDSNSKILFALNSHWPLNYYLRDYMIYYFNSDPIELDYGRDSQSYDLIVVSSQTTFDETKFKEYGEYEFRENFFIKLLLQN